MHLICLRNNLSTVTETTLLIAWLYVDPISEFIMLVQIGPVVFMTRDAEKQQLLWKTGRKLVALFSVSLTWRPCIPSEEMAYYTKDK